jgi:hypothetical protein
MAAAGRDHFNSIDVDETDDVPLCGVAPPADVAWTVSEGATCELRAGHDGYHEIHTLLIGEDDTVEDAVTSWLDY